MWSGAETSRLTAKDAIRILQAFVLEKANKGDTITHNR